MACAPDVTITILQVKDPRVTGTTTATDASGPVTVTYSDNASGLTNCNGTGQLLRTWIAVDPYNLTNTCLQTITVIDTNAPFFTLVSDNITTTNDLNQCSAVVTYTNALARELGFFEGFEDTNFVSDANDISWDWNDYNSHVQRVGSGTNGIIARSGAAYGLIDSTVDGAGPDYANSGAYSLLGGGIPAFGDGFRVSLDVYVNLSDPAVASATPTTGYAFDLDAASQAYNGGAGGYGRDTFPYGRLQLERSGGCGRQ